MLAQLGPEWTVLHSVPVGRGKSDIDHIAIGPPGVFTINTKFSPGKDVWVAGRGMSPPVGPSGSGFRVVEDDSRSTTGERYC